MINRYIRKLLYLKESLFYGSRLREKVLINLLERYYSSRIKRMWKLSECPPHFSDNQAGAFYWLFTKHSLGVYSYYRGFFSSEVISDGDCLLDIGCGDGFFTRCFFSQKCSHIDAIDIDSDAIETARKCYSAPNIDYHLLDATTQPFPSEKYDVIVWDGAIGHFASDTTNLMLNKIVCALEVDGIFIGSESLGTKEGHDHLQFFNTLDDFHLLFKKYFKYVLLRSVDYRINKSGFIRTEAYWRCSNTKKRIEESSYKIFS